MIADVSTFKSVHAAAKKRKKVDTGTTNKVTILTVIGKYLDTTEEVKGTLILVRLFVQTFCQMYSS